MPSSNISSIFYCSVKSNSGIRHFWCFTNLGLIRTEVASWQPQWPNLSLQTCFVCLPQSILPFPLIWKVNIKSSFQCLLNIQKILTTILPGTQPAGAQRQRPSLLSNCPLYGDRTPIWLHYQSTDQRGCFSQVRIAGHQLTQEQCPSRYIHTTRGGGCCSRKALEHRVPGGQGAKNNLLGSVSSTAGNRIHSIRNSFALSQTLLQKLYLSGISSQPT